MTRLYLRPFGAFFFGLSIFLSGSIISVQAQVLDQIKFGDLASEAAKSFAGTNVSTAQVNPVTGDAFRTILAHATGTSPNAPLPPAGTLPFTVACDPAQTNYLTVKFWGSDANLATFYIYTNGVRMGAYGTSTRELIWNQGAGLPGKYYYITELLPKTLTSGKTSLRLAIGAIGNLSPYSAASASEDLLTTPSPGVYCAYTSTNPFFTPVGETQGSGLTSLTPTPVNLPSAIAALKSALDSAVTYVTNRQIYGAVWQTATNTGGVPPAVYGAPTENVISTTVTNTTQGWLDLIANSSSSQNSAALDLIELCARGYSTSWSAYYHNPDMLYRITAALDFLCRKQGSNGGLSGNNGTLGWCGGPTRKSSGHSLEGYGDWCVGDAFLLLQNDLTASNFLTQLIDDDNNPSTPMIARSVAWANMFTNASSFLRSPSGRGHAPNQDYAQQTAMWLLNKSVYALNPAKALTTNQIQPYLYQCIGQLTNQYGGYWCSPKGLSLEPGGTGSGSFDFNYGVINGLGQINWLAQITGDPTVMAFADKMIGAASHFMFPEQDSNGYPIMTGEGFINGRNNFWPCEEYCNMDPVQSVYRTNLLSARAAQLALVQGFFPPALPDVGSAHFTGNATTEWAQFNDIIAAFSAVTNVTGLPLMPMESEAPDYAWGDEVAGSLAVKDGDTKFVMTLNHRRDWGGDGSRIPANQWTNNIASVHRITPQYDTMATFAMVDSTSFHGRYTAQYGPYRIVQNLQTNVTYAVAVPGGWTVARDLVSRCVYDLTDGPTIAPQTTLVLKQEAPQISDLGVQLATNLFYTSDSGGADGYVSAGTAQGMNYGTATTMTISRDAGAAGDNTSKAWIRFNTGTTTQRVVAAQLRLTLANLVATNAPFTYKVYGLRNGNSGENWSETGINWTNAPGNNVTNAVGMDEPLVSYLGNFITTTNNRAVGATIAFSSLALRDFLNQNTNGLATLMISAHSTNGGVETFAARENGTLAAPALALMTSTNSPVTSYTILENTSTPVLLFTAGSINPAATITVSVLAANTNLVPATNLVLSGSGFLQSLMVAPGTNQLGTTTVTLTVTDGINTSSQSFTLNVVSTAPSLIWRGNGVSNQWDDSVSTNWLNSALGQMVVFKAGAQVTFDDTGSRSPSTKLVGTLTPEVWNINTVNRYTFAGTGKVSGSTALNLNGTGSVILDNSGTNDFTGLITINAGILQVGTNDTNGNLPAGVGVINNGALMFSRSDSFTVNNPISGTGSLIKNGAGTLTLTASNTYAGVTVVDGGKLVIGAENVLPNSTSMMLGDSIGTGALDVLSFGENFAGLSTATTSATQTNTITIGAGQTLQVNGDVLVGSNFTANATTCLRVTGPGILMQTSGGLQLGGVTSGTAYNTATLDMASLANFTGWLSDFNVGDTGGSTSSSSGNSKMVLATNSLLNVPTLYVGNAAHGGSTNTLLLGAGTNQIQANNLYIGFHSGRANGQLLFNSPAGSVVVRDISGGTNGICEVGGALPGNTTGASIIGLVNFSGHPADVAVKTLAIGDRQGGNSTSGGATGTLTFDTGTLAAGTVIIGSGTQGTSAGAVVNGTLNLGGGSVNCGRIILATNSTGAGTVNGTLNLTGGTVSLTGDVIASSGTGTTASLTLDGATLNLNGHNLGGATAIDSLNILSGTLQNVGQINNGVGGLTKTGIGTLLMRGINTYGGGTTISAGTLGGDGRLSSAVTNQAGGTLQPGLGGGDTGTMTISNTLGLAGNILFTLNRANVQNASKIAGITTLKLGGTLTVTNAGPALQAGDTFVLMTAGSTTGTFAATNLPALNTGLSWILTTAAGLTLQVVSTVANLTWMGDGLTNTWDNGVTTNWFNGPLSQAAVFTLGSQANFDDTGSRSPAINLVGTLAPQVWNVTTTNSYTFAGSGSIAGSAALNKYGTGMVTLSTANTYSGGTTVAAGTLQVNNTNGSATGSGMVTIQSGGTLGGGGGIAGAVSINSGGVIFPGLPSLGTLTISNSMTLGGNVVVGLNKSVSPSNSVITASGQLTNTGNGTVTVMNLGVPALALGDRFQLFNRPLLNGQALTLASTPGHGLAWFNNLAVDGSILVIPGRYTWNSANAGNWNDTTANGWNTGGGSDYPNQARVAVTFSNNIGATKTIVLDVPDAKAGSLYLQDTASSYYGWRIATDANNYPLTLESATGNVAITENTAGGLGANNARVSCALVLSNNLDITVATPDGVAGSAQLLVGAVQGPGFTVTKYGAGSVSFENGSGGNNTFSTLVVATGTAMGHVTTGGNLLAPVSLIISNGATFGLTFANQIADTSAVTDNGTLDMNERTSVGTIADTIGTLAGSGTITCSNPAGSTNTLTVGGSGSTVFSGTIDDGTAANSANQIILVKAGAGTLLFNGVGSHIGGTLISGGILGGNGQLSGAVTNQSGGTLQPGLGGDTGTLTISNVLVLSGNTVFTLNRTNTQNASKLAGITSLTLGGTLTVTNAGPALLAGDTFTLFSATTTTGDFTAANLPALAPGLVWTNQVAFNSTIKVVSTINSTPTKLVASFSDGVLTLQWAMDHTGWLLQSNAVNLAAGNFWFDVPGSASTNVWMPPVNSSGPNVFYRLRYPFP